MRALFGRSTHSRAAGPNRLGVAAASLVIAASALGLGAAPVLASSNGTSETQVFDPGNSDYGTAVGLAAEVRDVSDSCTNLPYDCDAPHGTVDFYAVQGSVQSFLGGAQLWPDTEIFGPWSDTFAEGIPAPTYCCLEPGTYVLRGYYVPGDFDPSSDDSVPFTVSKGDTTTSLTMEDDTLVYGQTATFHVHVAPTSADPRAALPSGSVDVREGNVSYGTGVLDANGNATVTTTQLGAGDHSVHAVYSGDSHWTSSLSGAVYPTIDGGATNSSLGASATDVTYGDEVTFTTTVQVVAPASGTPTGSVTFNDGGVGGTQIGSGTLNESSPDIATYATSSLSVGSHTIQAFYGGDSNFNSSTTNSVTVNVSKANTTTSLLSSLNPSAFGDAVTFTASVSAPGTTTATGTIQFMDGSRAIGSPVTLAAGAAELTVSTLAGGTHSITAVYSGSTNLNGSTSGILSQVVSCDHTLTGSVSSLTLGGGSTCLSGARVTGNVTVPDGSSLSVVGSTIGGNVKAAGGAASLTICGSTVRGNVSIAGATGFLLLGDVPDDGCSGNSFKGNVALSANSGGFAVADNHIGGSLTATDNLGADAPVIAANAIGGYLTLAGNTPAATDDGRPNLVHGIPVAI